MQAAQADQVQEWPAIQTAQCSLCLCLPSQDIHCSLITKATAELLWFDKIEFLLQTTSDDKEALPVTDIDQVAVVISSDKPNEIHDNKTPTKPQANKSSKPKVTQPTYGDIFMEDKSDSPTPPVSVNRNDSSRINDSNKANDTKINDSAKLNDAKLSGSVDKHKSATNSIGNGQSEVSFPNPPTHSSTAAPASPTTKVAPPPPVSMDKNIALPSGSLFHLKQQRALQLQTKMRSLQTSQTTLNSDSGDSDPHTGSMPNVLPPSETNGHSPSLTNSRPTSPGSNAQPRAPGDPLKHRFTANHPSEIIGGPDEKQNCCIIL